jgi:hypothetical protein
MPTQQALLPAFSLRGHPREACGSESTDGRTMRYNVRCTQASGPRAATSNFSSPATGEESMPRRWPFYSLALGVSLLWVLSLIGLSNGLHQTC